ncbi:unnamed protein product [Lota lota]
MLGYPSVLGAVRGQASVTQAADGRINPQQSLVEPSPGLSAAAHSVSSSHPAVKHDPAPLKIIVSSFSPADGLGGGRMDEGVDTQKSKACESQPQPSANQSITLLSSTILPPIAAALHQTPPRRPFEDNKKRLRGFSGVLRPEENALLTRTGIGLDCDGFTCCEGDGWAEGSLREQRGFCSSKDNRESLADSETTHTGNS